MGERHKISPQKPPFMRPDKLRLTGIQNIQAGVRAMVSLYHAAPRMTARSQHLWSPETIHATAAQEQEDSISRHVAKWETSSLSSTQSTPGDHAFLLQMNPLPSRKPESMFVAQRQIQCVLSVRTLAQSFPENTLHESQEQQRRRTCSLRTRRLIPRHQFISARHGRAHPRSTRAGSGREQHRGDFRGLCETHQRDRDPSHLGGSGRHHVMRTTPTPSWLQENHKTGSMTLSECARRLSPSTSCQIRRNQLPVGLLASILIPNRTISTGSR